MRILRKSKEVEQVFHERNKDRPAVKEFFEFKDKITTKKTINGEEFEVLKNLEPLRDQFLKERKKILEAYRAKHRREVREVDTFTQETESNIQYPLPTSKNSLIGGTPYNPKHQDITFSESDNQPRPIKWLFGLGIFLAVALVTFFYLKKRTPKE